MSLRTISALGASLAFWVSGGGEPVPDERDPGFAWDARAVEHLLNRAGFGATRAEIEAGVRLGPDALVDSLFRPQQRWDWPEPVLVRWEDFGLDHMQLPLEGSTFTQMGSAEQRAACKHGRITDRGPFLATFAHWFDSMVEGRDPLRDRMTLFWHGFFTTSWAVNKRKYELMNQFRWLHANATGSYAELLHGIVTDPAMLQFLDNTSNVRGHPNENLARELMELYSLGEGNYTEVDVREAARALTGAACTSEGGYAFLEASHDAGEKLILGERGAHGPGELVEILLRQESCGRWVAARLIEYFEGLPPSEARLSSYAELLREQEYALEPFLRRLFTDREFYRAEVVGTRISAPIEHLAGVCHKLQVRPSQEFLHRATLLMGQGFYLPPSVKGWREGMVWISNDALMRRGNCMGLVTGAFGMGELSARAESLLERARAPDLDEALLADEWAEIESQLELAGGHARKVYDLRRQLDPRNDWKPWDPGLAFVSALDAELRAQPAELVAWLLDEWLACPVPQETSAAVLAWLEQRCAAQGVAPDALCQDDREFARMLPVLAHLVLSLPEAQLR